MKANFSVNSLNLMKNCVNFFGNFHKNSAKFSDFLAKFYAKNLCVNFFRNSKKFSENFVNFFANFYLNLAKFYARNFCLNSAKFSTKNSRFCAQNLQNKICQIQKDKR